jgi:hypothetical protein
LVSKYYCPLKENAALEKQLIWGMEEKKDKINAENCVM